MVRRFRLLTSALALLVPLLSAGCGSSAAPPAVAARRGDLPRVMVESGEVAAVRSRRVQPPMEWSTDLVVTWMLDEGSMVEEGDPVIRLDTSSLDRELVALEDKLADLETQRDGVLARQGSELEKLRNTVAMTELARDQAALQVEKLRFEAPSLKQDAQLRMSRALVDLDEARAKLKAQAVLDSLELAKTDLEIAAQRSARQDLDTRREAMTIRAPLSGMVVYLEQRDREGRSIKPKVGDTLRPWRPVIEIPDLTAMQVDFMIHEVDRHRVAVGMPVRVRLEAYPEAEFTGRIEEIARLATEVEEESSVRGFHAVAPLDRADPRLRPGMTAVIEIDRGAVADAVLVPREAVFVSAGGAVVYPLASWPEPRQVRLGSLTPLLAEVLAGVDAGERLAITAPAVPEDAGSAGAPHPSVSVTEPAAAAPADTTAAAAGGTP